MAVIPDAPLDLHLRDTGEVAGAKLPPLVLVHGLGACGDDWEHQIACFAPRCRVIAPDLRGHGRSPPGAAYEIEAYAADLWAALDRLGIVRCNLVGHSMGGAVILRMAVDRPERIQRLVLADTLPSFATDTFAKRLLYWYRVAMVHLLGLERLDRAVLRRQFPGPAQAALRKRLHERVERWDRNAYLGTLHALKGWTIVSELDRLTMPVLILAAQHDYFPCADAKAFTARLVDARLRIFAGGHHNLPLEMPERFNAALLDFLSTRQPTPPRPDAARNSV